MTDTTKGILLIGAAALWWRIKHNLNNISAQVEKVLFKRIDGVNAVFQINIIIKNPLLINIDVQEVAGSVYLYDVYLADIKTDIEQTIKANSLTRLSIDLLMDMSKIGDVLQSRMASGDTDTIQGYFDGRLVVENIQIPVQERFVTNIEV